MSYSCKLYVNSGFNISNAPDSVALLEQLSYAEAPALDITQGGDIGELRVAATWNVAKDVDYIRLTSGDEDNAETWYYFARPIRMAATDVAVFSVTPDYVLTGGGVSALNVIDGITERVHVADDTYGLYGADDPLLTPNEPLQLTIAKAGFDNGGGYNIFIDSTVNPYVTERALLSATFTYTDPQGNEYTVDVPQVGYNETYTTYSIGGVTSQAIVGTCIYNTGNQSGLANDMSKAVAFLRSINMEQGIIRQVALPTGYVTFTSTTKQSSYKYSDKYSAGDTSEGTDDYITYPYISALEGQILVIDTSTLNALFGYTPHTVKNNRVNYSNLLKYGIISTTGESAEYDPADLYVDGATAPSVKAIADPHLDGKPYFRFQTINGESSNTGFWRNCISGAQWKEVPLIYERPAGTVLNTLKFQNSVARQAVAYNWQKATGITGGISGVLSSIAGAFSAGSQDYMMASGVGYETITDPKTNFNGLQAASGSLASGSNAAVNVASNWQNYMANVRSELSDLVIANTIQVPQVNFPFNSDVIRDTYGNDCYVYRYTYSADDVTRIDKLLTMYGYKVTKPLEASDFTNRQYFNFVQCQNVSVTGHAQWFNDGIAEQLKNGVRFWHVLPNSSYYSDNPVVTATT